MPFDIKTKKKETPNSFKGITKTLKLQGQSHLPPLEEKSGINKISTVKEISCDNSRNRFIKKLGQIHLQKKIQSQIWTK